MLVGVLSDTHDRIPELESALVFFAGYDVQTVVHCGDWKSIATAQYCAERTAAHGLKLYGVLGNNDLDVAGFLAVSGKAADNFNIVEGVLELSLDGKLIAAYHGHHPPTRDRLLANAGYDVVLLGHTHKPIVTSEAGRLVVNPGSTAFSIPRSRGFKPSVALVDTGSMGAAIHYLL